ncbi:hypothetical protein NKJ81_28975 [Mesorhizobium sp. M0018]|uniref:hypothetical protein n=1 Tax=Mesorhizobium sp. M0018 TaxID=2956844 RepID=UPI003338D8FC
MINAVCGDISFGVNVSVATRATMGADLKDAALGRMLLAYNLHSVFIPSRAASFLQNCIWYRYDKSNFSSIADSMKIYMDTLTTSVSEKTFVDALNNAGC